jgi:alternate signal-mediated exported protein
MNKLTKGAIATAAGVILLMGGAGTLATWNSSANVGSTSQSIQAGSLAVSTPTATGWSSQAGAISNIANFRIVPGDVLTYTATYTLAATGDNLKFTVGTTPGAIAPVSTTVGGPDASLASALTSTAAYTVSGSNISAVSGQANTYKVASNSGTSTVTVTLTVTFPSTAGNATQLGSVTFSNGAITLTQV